MGLAIIKMTDGTGSIAAKKELKRGERKTKANSLEKMLSLLDHFTSATPVWSPEELMRATSTSRSTCYRYIKALTRAELLTPVENGCYVLGPRIMEMDRQIRLTDPVYAAGLPVVRKFTKKTGQTTLLCVLFSNSVMCIHQELADGAPEGLFSRGERRPLLLAAASKIILAHLPHHQLRGIYVRHERAIAEAGLGSDWKSFMATLRAMRQAGYAETTSEFQVGVSGVSAPIFNRFGHVLGSVGFAMEERLLNDDTRPGFSADIIEAGKQITELLRDTEPMMGLSPRAIG